MRIGALAKAAGIGVETVRYYERRGLLDEPRRSVSGYRDYPPSAVARLRFIRHAKRLGFTLREIRELLELRIDDRAACFDVRQRAEAKIADLDTRIRDLRSMKRTLERLRAACEREDAPIAECPIVSSLEHGEEPEASTVSTKHVATVLFACVHNAGRSQMAAAFFNALADPTKARAVSAGTSPGKRVHPEVVQALAEVGIDLTGAKPRRLSAALARQATLLITMGCGESCPVVPGIERDDWALDDPKGKSVAEVRRIRDEIRDRVVRLLEERGWGSRRSW